MDVITRKTLIEKLENYPTLLQQTLVMLDTIGDVLDKLQPYNFDDMEEDISKLTTDLQSISDRLTQEITRATSAETLNTQDIQSLNDTVADLQSDLNDKIDSIENTIINLNDNITNETTARKNSDNKLSERIDNNATNITNEGNARIKADTALQTNIDTVDKGLKSEISRAMTAETLNAQNIQSLNDTVAAVQTEVENKQDKLTAGDNITIEGNVISATGGGSSGGTKLYRHAITLISNNMEEALTRVPSRELLMIYVVSIDKTPVTTGLQLVSLIENSISYTVYTYTGSLEDTSQDCYSIDVPMLYDNSTSVWHFNYSFYGNSNYTYNLRVYDEIDDTVTEL